MSEKHNGSSTTSKLASVTDKNVRQAPQTTADVNLWPKADSSRPAPYAWPGEGSPAGAITADITSFHKDGD